MMPHKRLVLFACERNADRTHIAGNAQTEGIHIVFRKGNDEGTDRMNEIHSHFKTPKDSMVLLKT